MTTTMQTLDLNGASVLETNFGMKVTVEVINRAKALEYLSHELDHNRPLKPRVIREYKRLMQLGQFWSMDTLKFASDGRLLDGQHRLRAIVEGELEVPLICVWGAPVEAMKVIDSGRPRSLADQLFLNHEPYHNELSSALNTHYAYSHTGRYANTYLRGPASEWQWELPSTFELLAHFEKHPGLRHGLYPGKMVNQQIGGGRGRWAATHYILGHIDAEDRDFFFGKIISGAGLPESSPILELRNMMARGNRRNFVDGMMNNHIMYWGTVFKAWNLFRRGESGQILYRAGGRNPEPWPVLV